MQKFYPYVNNAIQLGFINFNLVKEIIVLKLSLTVVLQKMIPTHAQSVIHLYLEF